MSFTTTVCPRLLKLLFNVLMRKSSLLLSTVHDVEYRPNRHLRCHRYHLSYFQYATSGSKHSPRRGESDLARLGASCKWGSIVSGPKYTRWHSSRRADGRKPARLGSSHTRLHLLPFMLCALRFQAGPIHMHAQECWEFRGLRCETVASPEIPGPVVPHSGPYNSSARIESLVRPFVVSSWH